MRTEVPYCGITLVKMGNYYTQNIYFYVSTLISLVGVISNLLNVLVFTRKIMISSPNLIFTHLAVADLLILLARIPYVWVISSRFDIRQSYGSAIFRYHCSNFIVTFQFISIFLTVQLAVWRYIAVVHPLKEQYWCNMKITRNAVIFNYIMCCLLFTPTLYLMLYVETYNNGETSAYYYVARNEASPIDFYFLYFAEDMMVRSLSSILLAGFTLRLVFTLLARKSHQEQLTQATSVRNNMRNIKIRQESNRSTIVLLTVVAFFFTTEFPKGILSLLYMIYEHNSAICYAALIKIFITMSDFNSSITFVGYYILSQQFRTTFKSLFTCKTIFHRAHASLALVNTEVNEIIDAETKTNEV